MLPTSNPSPYKIITMHNISCVVASIFATGFIEIASNIIGDVIPITKAETFLMFAGVGSSMNR